VVDRKIFFGAYTRTIQTFTIPQIITNPENVIKPFRMKEMLKKLSDGSSPDSSLDGFRKIYPMYDFDRENKSEYKEKFWRLFWDKQNSSEASHFPFRTVLDGELKRDNTSFNVNLSQQWAKLKVRIFPYGVVSFQLAEYFKFVQKVESEKLIEYLQLPFNFEGKYYPSKRLLSELYSLILERVLSKKENFPSQSSIPYCVMHPQYDALPQMTDNVIEKGLDLDKDWNQISTLLAMSNDPDYLKKYTQQNCKNLSTGKDQFIFMSPFSTIVLTTPFSFPYHGVRCLRNHISNIVEMVLIQESFAKQYGNAVREIQNYLKDIQGYKARQAKRFIWNKITLDEILAIKRIIRFSDSLDNSTWKLWYNSLMSTKQDALSNFNKSINDLNTTNLSLGEDVRKSISSMIGHLKDISETIGNLMSGFSQKSS